MYIYIIIIIFRVNQITSYIDASNIYGSDISITKRLRLGRRGRLRVTKLGKEELLPLAPEECADFAKRHYCFAAGGLLVILVFSLHLVNCLFIQKCKFDCYFFSR